MRIGVVGATLRQPFRSRCCRHPPPSPIRSRTRLHPTAASELHIRVLRARMRATHPQPKVLLHRIMGNFWHQELPSSLPSPPRWTCLVKFLTQKLYSFTLACPRSAIHASISVSKNPIARGPSFTGRESPCLIRRYIELGRKPVRAITGGRRLSAM